MKQEFEMSEQEVLDIMEIAKGHEPVMKIGEYFSGSNKQETANRYWERMGDKYGFKHMSVEPFAKGNRFFLAEPKPIKTHLEKMVDEYDTLERICNQLEYCEYENQAGLLKNNIAFLALKRKAGLPVDLSLNLEVSDTTKQN